MYRTSLCAWALVASVSAAGGSAARAAVTPPPGYIYSPLLLATATQNCVAVGPGGTFVAVGVSFTANAEAIVLVSESGATRLIAFGFNSIGDCAYDAAADTLYVSDNADNTDLGISTSFGNTAAQTGDTVFAIDEASTSNARLASTLELFPAGSFEYAANLAVEGNGDLLLSTANGGGNGEVLRISAGPMTTTVVDGFDFTGGVAIQPGSGDILVAEFLASFDNQLHRFTAAGAPVASPLLGPSFGFGSTDLIFNTDGRLLVTGLFGGDIVAVDLAGPTASPFIGGLNFASGTSINGFTERIEVLSSTFSGADEDKSIHRFVPVSRLVAGGDSGSEECLHEFYGIELVAPAPGKSAKDAICVDGAECDADGVVNDSCLFPIGSCLNVEDPALPQCTHAAAIDTFTLSAVRDRGLRAAEASAVAALPLSDSRCFFSDGLDVAVITKSSGEKKAGKLKVVATVANTLDEKDKDAVTLVCRPAP